ncbi:MAG: YfcE family phosphodiesterase [Clostridiales bacterium]|nr:YfcE family phosphodiesterase [Clostridiales bacterium]
MKLLLLADSHGCWETIYKIALREKPDAILHAGDGQGAFETLALLLADELPCCELYNVRGNCDRDDRGTPTNLLVELGGLRIYLIHGHLFPELRFGVLGNAVAFAKKQRVDLLVYGHSHMQRDAVADGLRTVNPGAAYRDRYAVVVVGDGELEIRLM